MSTPVKRLECCVCGNSAKGRQWFNRDIGYGVCDNCIAWVRSRGMSEQEIHDLYGVEGEHFNVSGPIITRLPEMTYDEKVQFFHDEEPIRQRILAWQAAGAKQENWHA